MSKFLKITDEILINYLLQELDSETTVLVNEWLSESEENAQYYQQFQKVWEQSKILQSSQIPNEEDAWKRLDVKLKNRNSFKLGYTTQLLFAAAASLLLMIGVYVFWPKAKMEVPIVKELPKKDSLIPQKSIASNEQILIDTLADKSVVTLNRKAILDAPESFAQNERRVRLRGEAFFNIEPDKSKPFIIETESQVEIKVLGTSFNVKSYADFTEVIVETGTVQLKKYNKLITLHANEMVRIDNADSTLKVKKTKDKLYRYFRSREFECENTPLWKVVEVLNEAYEDTIIIGNQDLKKMTLTTRFSNESIESVLSVLSETFDIKVEQKGNQLILK